jgi:1-aminocyclopropane-1-carboxylate deaminase/D-cysteine desulfhydrase-like pyridoxal-dependent ACC family enzyme
VGEDGGTGAGTRLITDYTFGGFARTTPELLGFMQDFRKTHGVLLDFVYTAKMMYGITDMIRTGSLGPGDRILAIHSGGLQGNRSLDPALGLMP